MRTQSGKQLGSAKKTLEHPESTRRQVEKSGKNQSVFALETKLGHKREIIAEHAPFSKE